LAYRVSANAPITNDTDDVEFSTVRLATMMVSTLALFATVASAYVAVLSN
jgi:hypothetical protein